MFARPFATLFLIFALAAPAWAQETRGAVEGVVKDASGAVLPGATVEAKGSTGVIATTADASGVYRFPALAPGQYEILATLAGFKPSQSLALVAVGQLLKVDLVLAVGGLTEVVQVTASSPTIDVKQSTAATNIQSELIAVMPKGRDFQSLVTLAPGANQESRSGGISVDGASAAENKFYVDGVDATNLRTGVAATTFNTDFIEEVQVKSSGHAAEFGGATGGVISVISRSGTNQFSGSVGTYFNNAGMNGNLALNNTTGTGGATPGTGVALPVASGTRRELRLLLNGVNQAETVEYNKDDYSRWEPAFQLGGPIIKDKLWFWGGYAPHHRRDRAAPSPSARNGATDTFTSKETTQTFVRQRVLAGGGTGGACASPFRTVRSTQEGRLPLHERHQQPANGVSRRSASKPSQPDDQHATWTGSRRARVFINAKLNYLSYDTLDVGIPDENWYDVRTGFERPATRRVRIWSRPTDTTACSPIARASKDLEDWGFGTSADFTYYANAAGQHAFKGGIQFERIANDVADNIQQKPHVTVLLEPVPPRRWAGAVERGNYGYWSWRQFGTLGKVNVNNLGLFFQDAWTVSDRLTLNVGHPHREEKIVPLQPQVTWTESISASATSSHRARALRMTSRATARWKVLWFLGRHL